MFGFVLCCMLVQIAIGFGLYLGARHNPGLYLWLGLIVGLLGFCVFAGILMNPILAIQFVGLIALAVVLQLLKARPVAFLVCAILLSTGILVEHAISSEQRWAELQEKYPVQSLAGRLAYESSAKPRQAEQTSQPKWHEPPSEAPIAMMDLQKPLDDIYEDSGDSYMRDARARALQLVHSSHVDRFVNSPGFGVGRRISMERRLEYSNGEPSPLPQPANPSLPADDATPESSAPAPTPVMSLDVLANLRPLHESALTGFVNAEGFGWVQDIDHVAGFASHGFQHEPYLGMGDKQDLRLQRVELVSLLKHAQPMVYDSDHLPNMNELRNAPVRPLNAFENRALPAMQEGGRDLVSESTGSSVRMLGAIRAAKTCLNCHAVSPGALLGAFSYQFANGPSRKPEPKEAPPAAF